MKKMKLKLSAISVILIFAMIFGSLVSCGEPSEYADTVQHDTTNSINENTEQNDLNESTEQLETNKKEYWSGSVNDNFVDNQLLVEIQPYAKLYEYSIEDFKEVGCIEVKNLFKMQLVIEGRSNRWLVLTLDIRSKQNVIDCMKILQGREDITRVTPNVIVTLDDYTLDVHSDDTYYGSQWAISKINLPDAWNIETGSNDVLVGVLDTGIDATHPDLSGRINISLSESYTPEDTNPLEDPLGHGTHVAGIIGAAGNNSMGITGACWNIKLVSLRIFDESEHSSVEKIAEAIIEAEEKNIKILNMSFSSSSDMPAVAQAISEYSGLVVCTAGNTFGNNDRTPRYPASYDYDNIICVGNSRNTDSKAAGSCYGQNSVDLFAPGTSILSCYPTLLCSSCTDDTSGHHTTGYHSLSGTSMAAPYVTGVAALLLSHQSNLTASDIKRIILDNVDEVSRLSTYCVTGGRLNAYKALSDSAIHRSHTMTLDTSYQDAEKHRYLCYSCGHADYDRHNWSLVQNGTNAADASINYVPIYKCTVCNYTMYTSPSLQ